MRNGGIDKRVYVGEFVGSHFVHQPWKRWIDSVNDCPKKTCFGTERRMMYDDDSACLRVKGGESERFRIDSGVRQGCIMNPWFFNVYMDGVMKEVKMGIGRRGMNFLEDGREW